MSFAETHPLFINSVSGSSQYAILRHILDIHITQLRSEYCPRILELDVLIQNSDSNVLSSIVAQNSGLKPYIQAIETNLQKYQTMFDNANILMVNNTSQNTINMINLLNRWSNDQNTSVSAKTYINKFISFLKLPYEQKTHDQIISLYNEMLTVKKFNLEYFISIF
jgi:hypothetical protein